MREKDVSMVTGKAAMVTLICTEPLYVSQSGSDESGDGTEGNPLKTILHVSLMHNNYT